MTRRVGQTMVLVIAFMATNGCQLQLRRPATVPNRMLEPQLLEPQSGGAVSQVRPSSPKALDIRLLDTETDGQIGRQLLYLHSGGELVEDPVWRWAAPPASYLDTALRLEAAKNADYRLVDSSGAWQVAPTMLVWALDPQGSTHLVGAVEFRITGTNGVVQTKVIRESEDVSARLPGDVAAGAGRLLHRIASEGLGLVANHR